MYCSTLEYWIPQLFLFYLFLRDSGAFYYFCFLVTTWDENSYPMVDLKWLFEVGYVDEIISFDHLNSIFISLRGSVIYFNA